MKIKKRIHIHLFVPIIGCCISILITLGINNAIDFLSLFLFLSLFIIQNILISTSLINPDFEQSKTYGLFLNTNFFNLLLTILQSVILILGLFLYKNFNINIISIGVTLCFFIFFIQLSFVSHNIIVLYDSVCFYQKKEKAFCILNIIEINQIKILPDNNFFKKNKNIRIISNNDRYYDLIIREELLNNFLKDLKIDPQLIKKA